MKSPRIQAVFFDIDGTLVSFETHTVPESAREAIFRLREKGIKTFVSTGRPLSMTDVLGDLPFDGYITLNGTYCVDGNRQIIYASPLPTEDMSRLLNYLHEHPIPVGFITDREMTINFVDDQVEELCRHVNVSVPRIEDPAITCLKAVYQLNLYAGAEVEKYVMEAVMPQCTSTRWTHHFTDIIRQGNSKQTGIDKILAQYGIPLSETLSFGDGGNDIPMLSHTAVGVAMGNAGNDVKDVADYVTDTPENDGIWKYLIAHELLY